MDKKCRRALTFGFKHQLLLASIGFATAFSLIQLMTLVLGPRAEGRVFPVVKNVVLDSLAETPCENCVVLRGSFEKLRDCTFLDLLVTYGTPDGGKVGVPVRFIEGVVVRDTGIHYFGPWEADLSLHQFQQGTVIEAYHRCHPFWVTVTKFHPPAL